MSSSSIILFLDCFLQYCIFYFGEKEGAELYNYYVDNKIYIVPTLRNGKELFEDENFQKVKFIFLKIETDVFYNHVKIYEVSFPYNEQAANTISWEQFLLMRHDFYQELGEFKKDEKRIRLAFDNKIQNYLIENNDSRLFNKKEWNNKNNEQLENLYQKIKDNHEKILKKYQKHFRNITKEQLCAYIDEEITKTPQHISVNLWYLIRDDS